MIWYPYEQMKTMKDPYKILDAEGVHLYTKDQKLIDAISSWWCMIHGYKHPELTEAIKEQADRFCHVMLGGLTHEPVEKLSAKLQEFLPGDLDYCFFSDSGSVAVELYEKGIGVVPGIELGCEDGFELLVYFKKMSDLEEFYIKEVEQYKNIKRMAKTHRNIYEYMDVLQNWECHKSIPHICGLVQKNFINNKPYIYDIIKLVDSLETHNHALSLIRNLEAAELREKYGLTATFGSDAHIIREAVSYYKYSNMDQNSIVQ